MVASLTIPLVKRKLFTLVFKGLKAYSFQWLRRGVAKQNEFSEANLNSYKIIFVWLPHAERVYNLVELNCKIQFNTGINMKSSTKNPLM